jgi:hypothetical protein
MDDNDRGSIWIWAGLACSVVFFVAAYKSVDEFYYWHSGTKTRGLVTSVVEDRPEGPRVGYVVWYAFTTRTTGRRMRGSADINATDRFKYVNGKPIDIEYFGDPFVKSRIQGTGSQFWPALFGISALATIACIIPLTVRTIRQSRAEATNQFEGDESEDEEVYREDES